MVITRRLPRIGKNKILILFVLAVIAVSSTVWVPRVLESIMIKSRIEGHRRGMIQAQIMRLQQAIESYCTEADVQLSDLPSDLSTLLKQMKGFEVYETWLSFDGGEKLFQEGRLVDVWGHEIQWHDGVVYSVGPNGIDEGGKGDDVK